MTLVITTRCRDGVTIASDSRIARYDGGRTRTESASKIYEARSGFLFAWAGSQPVAQDFALLMGRSRGLSPRKDRMLLKEELLALFSRIGKTTDLTEGVNWTEVIVAWMDRSGVVPRPVALWLHSSGKAEWVADSRVIGTASALDLGYNGLNTLRFVDLAERTVEQAKIIVLKVMRDAIVAAPQQSIGGEVQLGSLDASGVTVVRGRQLRPLLDTLDLWEEQAAELLPGAPDTPAASDQPDTGVGPPGG